MRLYQLVITEYPKAEDLFYARRLSMSVLKETKKPVGLPSPMWEVAKTCAEQFWFEGRWRDHLFLCLILSQMRNPSTEPAEIKARVELEHIIMSMLYGFPS